MKKKFILFTGFLVCLFLVAFGIVIYATSGNCTDSKMEAIESKLIE